jgi:hypothetical protein
MEVPIGELRFAFLRCKIADHLLNEISSVVNLPVAMCGFWWPTAHIKQNKTSNNIYIYIYTH